MPEIGRRAFTLLELLIVILLLSIFAFMVFGSMKRQARKPSEPKVTELRRLVRQEGTGDRELFCVDECRRCMIRERGGKERTFAVHFPPLVAYGLDRGGQPRRLEFGRWHDKKVCLRFWMRANGSNDQMILESGGSYYFVPAYFGTIETFGTLEAARDRWLRDADALRDRGDYY